MNLPSTTHLLALLCLFFATLATPLSAQAPKVKKVPFHGKLEAVDPSAQTITLSGKSARIFHLTPSTKITDGAGNPSSLAAATVGEDVGGSYSKGTDGTMTLFSVRFGAKTGAAKSEKSAAAPAPAPIAAATASAATTPAPLTAASVPAAAAPEKKKRFSGKITAVDEAAGTVARPRDDARDRQRDEIHRRLRRRHRPLQSGRGRQGQRQLHPLRRRQDDCRNAEKVEISRLR